MGFFDDKESTMVVSSNQFEERLGRASAEIKCVASAPKFKWRRVSVVWDFPLGCRRVAAPNSRSSKQIIVDRSSQGATAVKVCIHTVQIVEQ
ncbi:hypothetical protein J1N35_040813 [Gossypium stocksii]|uniref:Uncharacterized protein n=1 Tax=Gossypium stocksii TaxID=47602 RepID=A0A9D3ZI23_9ROSI|nr:hypothetical protein J1N35_040813 [Gossypium stocksii]